MHAQTLTHSDELEATQRYSILDNMRILLRLCIATPSVSCRSLTLSVWVRCVCFCFFLFRQVSAVIFGFLNIARALVPVRIALTLGTAPLVDKYIIQPFNLDKKDKQ